MEKDTGANIRIGFFGGTFNPVHLGHLRAAEEIREELNLSKIIFIPSHIPPHKKQRVTPSDNRFEMVKLAISGNPYFEVSDIELKRQGSSYSFETIEHLNNFYKNEKKLYFIIGLDAFREIHIWKKYPHFFSMCNFIVMSRPGLNIDEIEKIIPDDIAMDFKFNNANNCFVHKSGNLVYFLRITLLDISSTEIRKLLENGQSIKYLVPLSVELYIKEHDLY